jgi:hypothetical protein
MQSEVYWRAERRGQSGSRVYRRTLESADFLQLLSVAL